MKQNINEIKRMQQLAGLIKENQASNLENMLKFVREYNDSPNAGKKAEYQSITDFVYFLNSKGYSITQSIKESNIDQNKLKQYHSFLLKLGGGDLAGDYKDMLDKANQYTSFEEFVNDDIETLAGEDEEQASEIRQWVDSNL